MFSPTLKAPVSISTTFAAILSTVLASRPCYFPDGTYIAFDLPCNSSQSESMCCGKGHTCMSNGLCRWPDNQMVIGMAYVRGSCTDKSWNSPNCGRTCNDVIPGAFDIVASCPGGTFCCALDNSKVTQCCGSSANTFSLDASASTVTVLPVIDGATTTTSPAASTMTATTTLTSAASVSPPQTVTALQTSTQTPVATGSNKSHTNVTAISIGASLGGVILLAAISGFFFWRKRRRGTNPADAASHSNQQKPGDGTTYMAEHNPMPQLYEQQQAEGPGHLHPLPPAPLPRFELAAATQEGWNQHTYH